MTGRNEQAEDDSWRAIADSPLYAELLRERSRLSWTLTVIMLVVYFGYILLIAFEPSFLARPIGTGTMTIGIPLGLAVIVVGIVLTGIYVRRANRRFDALTADIVAKAEG